MFVLFQCPLCMEPLELDLTRCLTFVDVCFVSVSAVYGATRVGLDSMSDVCVDVCFSVRCVWSH